MPNTRSRKRPPSQKIGLRAIRILASAFAATLGVLILMYLLIAALSPLRVTFLAPQIVELAEALIGHKFEVRGDVWITFRRLATIKFSGLTVAAPDNTALVNVGELSATLNPWALLVRELDGEIGIRQLTTGFLTIDEARAQLTSGSPLQLNGTGFVSKLPGKLELRTAPPETFLEPAFTAPVDIALKLADARLDISAEISVPPTDAVQRMAVVLQGTSLDAFRTLVRGATLPKIGQYALKGTANLSQDRFSIDKLDVTVGKSDLQGSFVLDSSQPRSRIDLSLQSRVLQLDDILVMPTARGGAGSADRNASEQKKTEKGWVGDALLGDYAKALKFMADLDGNIKLDIGELRSGRDVMGGGRLGVTLRDQRLTVEPFEIKLPGGGIAMSINLDGTNAKRLHAAWTAKIERFDIGILARRLDPGTTFGGLISLRAKLDMRHALPEKLLAGANGHLDIGVWPKNIGAGLIDLWAVNLLNAFVAEVDPERDGSTINCVIARTTFKDGLMVDDVLFIDTSRIIAGAEIAVDFEKEEFEVYAVPKSKTPQLFAAKTPIRATGKFNKFEMGPAPGGLVQTAFRIIMSPITYPFELLFAEKVSADGRPYCNNAFTRPVEELRTKARTSDKKIK